MSSSSAISSFSIDLERQLGPSPPPILPSRPLPSTSATPIPRAPRTTTPRPISGAELGERRRSRSGRRMSRAAPGERPASRNFSRPSPASSVNTPVNDWPRARRRSSDDIPQLRRLHSAYSMCIDTDQALELPGSLPPFGALLPPPPEKGCPDKGYPEKGSPEKDLSEKSTSEKGPLGKETLMSFPVVNEKRLRSTKSMDVMDAARKMAWEQKSEVSALRLTGASWEEQMTAKSTSFAQRVFEAGKPDLMYDLRETKRLKEVVHGVLDLTTLERMNQHVLQQKLVEQVKAIGDKCAWMEIGIQQTLHDYCNAIRDMEFMEQCALRGRVNDPFLIMTDKPLEAKLLEDAGLALGDPRKSIAKVPGRLEYTKRPSWAQQALHRLLMALLGGLALVAPFLVMTLISGQMVRLIITSACMVGFAVAVTLGSELGPERIALVTAAYAAALVVFVGNNPPSYSYGA